MDDEFGPYLADALGDPQFRTAYDAALVRHAIVDALVQRRKALGLSQSDLARRIDVSQPTVSEFEAGRSDPRVSTILRYACAVDAQLAMKLALPEAQPRPDVDDAV